MSSRNKYWYQSLYGTKEWSLIRKAHLLKQPYCTYCQSTLSLQVDHIFDHKGNNDLFTRQTNLQTLCIEHHAMKGALDKYYFNNLEVKDGTLILNYLSSDLDLQNYLLFTQNRLKALEKYFNEQEVKLTEVTLHVKGLSLGDMKHLVNLSLKKMKSRPARLVFKGGPELGVKNALHSYLKTPGGSFKNLYL